MDSSFNHTSLVLKGAQLLKLSMVSVSVGFLYHPQLIFLFLSIIICKPKNANFPDVFGVFFVNCKLGCSKFSARNTSSGSPLTILTISST